MDASNTKPLIAALPEVIIGANVALYASQPEDAEELYSVIESDRERLTRAGHWVVSVHDVAQMRARLERGRQHRAEGTATQYMVRPRANVGEGPIVGAVSIFGVVERRCEIGYWIAGPHEGRGWVSDGVRALGAACFDAGIHRIELRCAADNKRSSAVALRCGYQLEGRLRDVRQVGGGWADDLLFSRLRTDE